MILDKLPASIQITVEEKCICHGKKVKRTKTLCNKIEIVDNFERNNKRTRKYVIDYGWHDPYIVRESTLKKAEEEMIKILKSNENKIYE